MIPENNLVERNSNVISVCKALILSENYDALYNLGLFLTEQHVSLKQTFLIMTSGVKEKQIKDICFNINILIEEELKQSDEANS